jgi:hypothetical protein
MPIRPPSHLLDEPLTRALAAAISDSRTVDAVVIAHIAEFDARELYLPLGCRSMFRYCVDRLHMSDDVAYKRVHVARVARRVPAILDALEDGRLNVSGVAMLARHLTRKNASQVLRPLNA